MFYGTWPGCENMGQVPHLFRHTYTITIRSPGGGVQEHNKSSLEKKESKILILQNQLEVLNKMMT
jgi:hypothetical protein